MYHYHPFFIHLLGTPSQAKKESSSEDSSDDSSDDEPKAKQAKVATPKTNRKSKSSSSESESDSEEPPIPPGIKKLSWAELQKYASILTEKFLLLEKKFQLLEEKEKKRYLVRQPYGLLSQV